MRLVLASRSPRRAELLRQAGFEFEVEPADIDERARAGELPRDQVLRLSADKAALVAARVAHRPVVGADTLVALGARLLGKPRDDLDAADMLRSLSGRTHEVWTGLTVRFGPSTASEAVRTLVTFVPLIQADIDWYVASGEPRDKAGAYAIQGLGARFVERIDGSYSNVVGLPIACLSRLLDEVGVPPPSVVDRAR